MGMGKLGLGLDAADFDVVAGFLHRGCELAARAQRAAKERSEDGKVPLRAFEATLREDDDLRKELEGLREEVEEFASAFDMPGY